MNPKMAYLIGMVLGNGEIQQGNEKTKVRIEIPHKNLYTEDRKEIPIYVKASVADIRSSISDLLDESVKMGGNDKTYTEMSFEMKNENYIISELIKLTGKGTRHTTMYMDESLFSGTSVDEKKALLRGFADVTGYIRASNKAFGQEGAHRVYLEIPGNWQMVADVANMLKAVDIPVQTIDFGHPNFRDAACAKYNQGKPNFWKKEHQIKIFANEFLPIGFNVKHKQEALEKYSEELLRYISPRTTHLFYWEKKQRNKWKPIHPGEFDPSLPDYIRGKHFESWTELAELLGYGK